MSFYTSLTGLKNAQSELSVVAHNLANAETAGFKKSRVSFSDIVAGSASANPKLIQGIGSTVEAITQVHTLGPIDQTGAALDMAINGTGFFTTVDGNTGQTFYTRNGTFSMDDQGFVLDGDNHRLQVFPTDATGTVTSTTLQDLQMPATNTAVPPADFAGLIVNNNGNVVASFADGSSQVVGKVALATFISPSGLLQVGSTNWQATGLSGPAAYGEPTSGAYGGVLSGSLERSNVDPVKEIIDLIILFLVGYCPVQGRFYCRTQYQALVAHQNRRQNILRYEDPL